MNIPPGMIPPNSGGNVALSTGLPVAYRVIVFSVQFTNFTINPLTESFPLTNSILPADRGNLNSITLMIHEARHFCVTYTRLLILCFFLVVV